MAAALVAELHVQLLHLLHSSRGLRFLAACVAATSCSTSMLPGGGVAGERALDNSLVCSDSGCTSSVGLLHTSVNVWMEHDHVDCCGGRGLRGSLRLWLPSHLLWPLLHHVHLMRGIVLLLVTNWYLFG